MNNLVISRMANVIRLDAPTILMASGVVAGVGATVSAAAVTPRAIDKYKSLRADDISKAAAIARTSPYYIPAISLEALSIFCETKSHKVMRGRLIATATRAAVSEEIAERYREHMAKAIGPKKEKEMYEDTINDMAKDIVNNHDDILHTGHGETLCIDTTFNQKFYASADWVRKCMNKVEDKIKDEMFASVNDFYYFLGLRPMDGGDNIGWNANDATLEDTFVQGSYFDGDDVWFSFHYSFSPRFDWRGLL